LSRVSHLVPVLGELRTEELVVDLFPAAHHGVLPPVAPSTPATPLKKRAIVKGKAPICQTNHPCARKVMWITSPSPGVTEAPRPNPPVSGPSSMPQPGLFVELIPSGSGEVEPDVLVPPGELSLARVLGCD